jgi:hypothetical protein
MPIAALALKKLAALPLNVSDEMPAYVDVARMAHWPRLPKDTADAGGVVGFV